MTIALILAHALATTVVIVKTLDAAGRCILIADGEQERVNGLALIFDIFLVSAAIIWLIWG